MKINDSLELIQKYFNGFVFHERFLHELVHLLKHDLRGKKMMFFKCLVIQLNYVRTLGILIHTADSHEKLRYSGDHYYSIHVQNSQFNVRMLAYISDQTEPIFLCVFHERSDHRSSNYTSYVKILNERLTEIMEEKQHG